MSAPATDTGSRHAFSICITASCSRCSPHCRYLTGSACGDGGALSNAFANSPRNGSSTNADGLAMMAATSSCNRDLSPPPRTNLETKSVARRAASPRGTPNRKESFVFILHHPESRPYIWTSRRKVGFGERSVLFNHDRDGRLQSLHPWRLSPVLH